MKTQSVAPALEMPLESAVNLATAARPARMLGMSLDALVRATRSGIGHRAVALRTMETLKAHQTLEITFAPTFLSANDEVGLETSDVEARWLLPVYMAGLRGLKARPDLTLDDMLRLSEEFAGVEPTVASITRLKDWLWADGAEGFEVRLHPSFCEMIEAVAHADDPSALPSGLGAAIDPAVLRDSLRPASIEALEELAPDDVDALRRVSEDPNDWVVAEVEAVLSYAKLREVISPSRLARQIQSRMAQAVDARFLELLAKMHERVDPFWQAIATALETEEVGALVARSVRLDDERSLGTLAEFLKLASGPVTRALAVKLLDRAKESTEATEGLATLVRAVTAARYLGWIEGQNVDGDSAAILVRAARAGGARVSAIGNLLENLNPEAITSALRAVHPHEVAEMRSTLCILASAADVVVAETLAELILSQPLPEVVAALGERLRDTSGEGWTGHSLYVVCNALVAAGYAKEQVVPIARHRTANPRTRMVAFDCIADNPELVIEACRFHVSEILDPPEIRARIAELRAKTKGR